MADFLVFQLYAPLASWGDIAIGERRGSDDRPSRSALLGLVAGALGIRRDEEERHRTLSESLCVGVEICVPGRSLADYHTAQAPKGKGPWPTRAAELAGPRRDLFTVLSRRYYYAEAYWKAALWAHNGAADLGAIEAALKAPVYTPYLGRKACPPALPLNPRRVAAAGLADAFAAYPDDATLSDKLLPPHRRPSRRRIAADLDALTEPQADSLNERRDAFHSRVRWQFVPRTEVQYWRTLEETEDRDVPQPG